jgi:hypothetical protein
LQHPFNSSKRGGTRPNTCTLPLAPAEIHSQAKPNHQSIH